MDMEVQAGEDEGLLRRQRGGKPRKGEEEDVVAASGAGEDVEVNESRPGRSGVVLDVQDGWVGAVVNGVGEDGHPEKQDEGYGEEVVVLDEVIGDGHPEKQDEGYGEEVVVQDEVIMRRTVEKRVSWDFSDEEREEIRWFRPTDSTVVEEYNTVGTAAHKASDEQPGHGRSFESLKEHLCLQKGAEVEVISGLLYSDVEGVTDRKHLNGVVGMGGDAVILEEANKEETLEEDDTEETEYDVENVLEKQNTHDLFCPNCKSCITRRVILCKKRRKVRNLRYRLKVDKVERVPISASNSESAATNINEDRISVANDEAATREVEVNEDWGVFRCLSCFGFFICTGDGQKPFWNGGKKLGGDVQVPPQESSVAWANFFSFLRKQKVAIEQVDKTTVEEQQTETEEISDSLTTNQTIAHQNGVSVTFKGTSIKTNTVLNMGPTTDSTKDVENSSMDSDKKVADSLQNGVSLAMNGDSPTADSLNGVGLHKDAIKVPGEIENGDTLSKVVVEDSTSIYEHNSVLSEPLVEKTTIKIEQTVEEKVKKREPSKVIQPSSGASWVLGHTHIEIDHTTVTEMAKHLPAAKGLLTLPDGVTSMDQTLLSKASAAIVNSLSAPGKQLIKDVEDLSLQSAKIIQDAVEKTIGDVTVVVEPCPPEGAPPQTGAQTSLEAPRVIETGQAREFDIVKSIVYGGLVESITSLGIVSSAAGGGASTLNTLALALANVFGGLIVIAHSLRELKNEQPSSTATGETQDRYTQLLGNRQHFLLHASIVVLSFIVFGAVAPVTYAFSFRKSDSRDYKLAAVAGASLSCIFLLAIGKARVRTPPTSYLKTISYYLVLGVTASGISFLVGELFDYLLQKLGWFSSSSSVSDPLLVVVQAGYRSAPY